MSVATTVAAFQALHATITGITSAPTEMPVRLNAVDLPLVFTFPGPSVEDKGWSGAAGAFIEHRRIYNVRCYVRLLGTGDGVDEGYQETIALLQRFGEAYIGDMNLTGAVSHLGPGITDSGWRADFRWGDEESAYYHGFQFQIEVVEKGTL